MSIDNLLKLSQPILDFLSKTISNHPWEIFWFSVMETVIIFIMWKWYKVQDISHLEKSINQLSTRMFDVENTMKEFGGALDKLKEENFELRKDLENQLKLFNQKNQDNVDRLQTHTKSQIETLKQDLKKMMKNNSNYATEIKLLKKQIEELLNQQDFDDGGSSGGKERHASLSQIRDRVKGNISNKPGGRTP